VTVRQVHRPARVVFGVGAPERVEIEAPPVLPEGGGHTGGGMQALLPAVGMTSSLVMMLVFRGSVMVVVGA
jgi:S-DNA-T family DNA segregation ATPase FtsK/SpoIIIE